MRNRVGVLSSQNQRSDWFDSTCLDKGNHLVDFIQDLSLSSGLNVNLIFYHTILYRLKQKPVTGQEQRQSLSLMSNYGMMK